MRARVVRPPAPAGSGGLLLNLLGLLLLAADPDLTGAHGFRDLTDEIDSEQPVHQIGASPP